MASPDQDQEVSIAGSTPISKVSSCEPATSHSRTKRPSESMLECPSDLSTRNRRKAAKVSRACDYCKNKKIKCTGTIPCDLCAKKGFVCQYEAQYRRGRPLKPHVVQTPTSQGQVPNSTDCIPEYTTGIPITNQSVFNPAQRTNDSHTLGLPNPCLSPALGATEIEGQIIGPTSNLTFIHRAWKRLALQSRGKPPNVPTSPETSQPLMRAGDAPFPTTRTGQELLFVNPEQARELFNFYFDECVVTYRLLNQQQCLTHFHTVLENFQNNNPLHHGIGHGRAAIVVSILAIASFRQHKTIHSSSLETQSFNLKLSEQYFAASLQMTEAETGLPQLESVQARILQVLYLLQSSRMNQAWYVFGCTVPIASAIGLHRKSTRHRAGGSKSPTMDYITLECYKRTFWVAYTIDKYLAVVFGRPRFYHSDDADQDFPDRVNDEDMTSNGPGLSEPQMDCHVDSMIFHARIAQIVDTTSREVYPTRSISEADRLAAAQRITRQLQAWRQELPIHLGNIRPSSLIPSFRRQATALKLAHCHAVMHANRPFLLDSGISKAAGLDDCVLQCLEAAKSALETIDGMLSNKSVPFCVLWWTPYVTFCALAVVYVWEIQQKALNVPNIESPSLFTLAERCQSHLASAVSCESASRRYSVIIEELRVEARQSSTTRARPRSQPRTSQNESLDTESNDCRNLEFSGDEFHPMFHEQYESHYPSMLNPMSQWQAADWLELDSSVRDQPKSPEIHMTDFYVRLLDYPSSFNS
ncbi:hypothetical protein S40293_03655 [Stachybotrys chartarum IBT 40293]|nr:hypothetical protein S40293_03655 [Stachybotrys chartarum IBT 40293]